MDPLEFLDEGVGGTGEPDSGVVGEEWGDEGFICENFETGGGARDKGGYLGEKMNMGSKDTTDL